MCCTDLACLSLNPFVFHPTHRDGSIKVNDRILAVGPKMLGKSTAAHKEAVGLLQKSSGTVELWMARPAPSPAPQPVRVLPCVDEFGASMSTGFLFHSM